MISAWKECDFCGRSPCVSACTHCGAPYCSVECATKDMTDRENEEGKLPMAGHDTFCPDMVRDVGKDWIITFGVDPFVIRIGKERWHALPGPISEPVPHNMIKKGTPAFKALLSKWIKIPDRSKGGTSARYFLEQADVARIMSVRMNKAQVDELSALMEIKKKKKKKEDEEEEEK